MKSLKTLLFCSLFLSAGSLSAQTFSSLQLNIGASVNDIDFNRKRDDIWRSFPERFNPEKGRMIEGLVFFEMMPKFLLGTGIHFNHTEFDHLITGIRTGGDIFNGTFISYEETVTLNHIGIPIQAQYVVFEKKIKAEIFAGCLIYKPFTKVSETQIIGSQAQIDTVFLNARPLEKINDPSGLNIAPYAGLDVSYPFTKKDFIKIGLRKQWYLLKEDYYYNGSDDDVTMQGWFIGYEHKINNEK